jgi:MFS family permease
MPGDRHSQFALLRERRFAPFFWTQFLGAANDNVFKNAFVVFVTFEAARGQALHAGTIVNLIGAVFIVPFMVFSATSGQLADRLEKSRLIRFVKLLEIAIMAIGLAGFLASSVALLFVALALLGIHSTLFGPVKYAILPQQLRADELVGGNALVESGTFVAILLGTIAGGLVVAVPERGRLLAGALGLALALAGYAASRRIPHARAAAPDLAIRWNPFTQTWRVLALAREDALLWHALLAISWFWFYGAIYLAQLPAFTAGVLGGDAHVFTLLLALFSIGIGVGALLCERLSAHRVELGLVPFGALGLTVFAIDLWLATRALSAASGSGVAAFVTTPGNAHVCADVALLGVFGGFYTVPLYALLQMRAPVSHRSRIIAANNVVNAVFIVASAVLAIALLRAGSSIPQLFLIVGLMNAIVAAGLCLRERRFARRFVAWIRPPWTGRRAPADEMPML